jgi:hypothetical protein
MLEARHGPSTFVLDHLIIGQPMGDRQGYFSFKEGGVIG